MISVSILAHKAEDFDAKCYDPDQRLRNYLERKLIYQKALAKQEAGGKLAREELEIMAKERSLRTIKSELLDEIIFPAMANLTFFFESAARHPELQTVFADDIKELLGVKRHNPHSAAGKRNAYGFMFQRLVDSMVFHDLKARPAEERRSDYRARLLNIMQDIVQTEIQHQLPDDLSIDAQGAILHDAFRVSAWTGSIALRVPDDCDKEMARCAPRKTFDFSPI